VSISSCANRARSASSRGGLLCAGIALFLLVFIATVPRAAAAPTSEPFQGAAFTTVDENVDGSGHCKNGNPDVNCNIYDGKDFVWMNGGPSAANLDSGTYFFAVLGPSGQANPNDGSPDLLSTDAYTDRTFSVSAGTVNYTGPHDFDSTSNKIRLMPYDDTPNPGGVYIMAICTLANGYPVDASDCKYDQFKISSGTVTVAKDLTITKDAGGSDTNTFTWDIKKSVDNTKITNPDGSAKFNYTVSVTHDAGTISAAKVAGTIQVFNPNLDSGNNPLPVDISGVTDTLSDGTVCDVTNGGAQIVTGAKASFAYSCTLSGLPQSELDNTATVSWPDQFLSDGSVLAGNSAAFKFSNISFAETKVDDCVDVTDTLGGSLGTPCSTDPSPVSYQYSHTVTGTPGTCVSQDNTAMFTTNTTGTTSSDSKTVTYCQPVNLTVSKDATPKFTRTYNWNIKKTVDKTYVDQLSGSVVLNYNVVAKETGFSDGAWQVAGNITVTNPNDFEDITADVADAIDNNGSCSVTGGSGVLVPAGKSVSVSYTCTYTSAPSPSSGTNTGRATWDQSAANTPDGSAQGTAAYAFGSPTSNVNPSITVTDTFNGGSAATLGTVTATDAAPFASATYTPSKTVSVVPNSCVPYLNLAAIKETGQMSSVSTTVCGAVTGGLTMGFWQNKNGQGIITGQASTGTCPSTAWLRQYAPFQDLSATATCSQVATYVYNLIKAANASGAAMNAMLKGQMLATALDVYFSTPSLGGNKINAPTPLGGVNVDLTKICHMIDSSTGAAACSGTYESVSSAFGGVAALKISNMLSYAAGQSNVGGSTWYAQNKTTQGLAKDAFDAINNGVAFAAP
jgi:hypothetical protein